MDQPIATDAHAEIRAEVAKLCARFPGAYWRRLDRERAYPTEFVQALTEAGYLAALEKYEAALQILTALEDEEGQALTLGTETKIAYRLSDTERLTLVLVEQHTRLALEISPRAVVMDRGRIVYDGPSEALAQVPAKLERLIGVGKRG